MKWHPKSLFDACLREGVLSLSSANPATLDEVIANAVARYMGVSANPGLDLLSGDPYQVAKDWCAVLSTVLTAISRLSLLVLHRTDALELLPNEPISWLPLSFIDESGTLHRWLSCDSWDADAKARTVHSWLTVGDMAILDAPMTLHVIEVGSLRNGRRHSPWCRAYRHPVIAGRLRFQRPDGKGGWRSLKGAEWEPTFLSDMHGQDISQWVDLMQADGIISSSLHHPSIAPLSEESRALVLRQIQAEAMEMHKLESATWDDIPMARGACDGWRPCAHQVACYSPDPTSVVAESGLYQIAGASASERLSTLVST